MGANARPTLKREFSKPDKWGDRHPDHKVELDGVQVASISKGWTRNGGEGWVCHSERFKMSGTSSFRSIEDVLRELRSRIRRGM